MRMTKTKISLVCLSSLLIGLYGCGGGSSDQSDDVGPSGGSAGASGALGASGATDHAGGTAGDSSAGRNAGGKAGAGLSGEAGNGDTDSGGSSGATTSGGTGGASGGSSSGGGTAGGATGGSAGTSSFKEGTELKAFPTAEGYGRYSKGGRGGKVIEVTNLNDSGAGSLRAAVMTTGARTIVFTVGGAIQLKSKIVIDSSLGSVTVAGQTAPGKGIQIRNYAFGMIGGSDVLMRFVRVGIGGVSMTAMDGMGLASAENSIYDHCSINWTIDEAFSSRNAHNITLQRTMLSECLNQSYHYNDSTADHTGTQPHGFAASISGSIGSFHHNLLAHCAGRNWSLAGNISKDGKKMTGDLDITDNVVYNWQYRTTDGQNHNLNFVNNYYKPGPASTKFTAISLDYYGWVPDTASWYISGNVMPGHFTATETSKSFDWVSGDVVHTDWIKSKPLYPSYVTTESAADAYTDVLANVGANVPSLDDHDKRIIKEVQNGTYTYKGSVGKMPGIIDDEADAGGFESFPTTNRPAGWDTDHDGIPDAWEKAHGLNPSDASDGNKTNLSKLGYTNLEMYLNELAGDFK